MPVTIAGKVSHFSFGKKNSTIERNARRANPANPTRLT
jgi:hypothetical protein